MSTKQSKRRRYITKWNGPDSWARRKKCMRYARAGLGGRNDAHRLGSAAYFCRFQGWYPSSERELCRIAGLPWRHETR